MSEKILERDVQRWLALLLRGRREAVLVDVGRLDIRVVENGMDCVIEVKKASNFLHAIGQVIGYSTSLSKSGGNVDRVRVVALFDWQRMRMEKLQECRDICKRNKIHCWLLDEYFLKFMYELELSQAENGKDFRPHGYFIDQYLHHKVKEDRRLSFHNSMKTGRFKDENNYEIEEEEYSSDSEGVIAEGIEGMVLDDQ